MRKARDTYTLTNLANQSYCSSSINCYTHKYTTFAQFKIKYKEIDRRAWNNRIFSRKISPYFVNGKEFLVDGNLLGKKSFNHDYKISVKYTEHSVMLVFCELLSVTVSYISKMTRNIETAALD